MPIKCKKKKPFVDTHKPINAFERNFFDYREFSLYNNKKKRFEPYYMYTEAGETVIVKIQTKKKK